MWRGAVVALVVGLGGVACQVPSTTQPGPAETHVEMAGLLAEYIEHQIADKGIPSIAIALIDGNQVVWANAFGIANLETGERATVDTIYRVGSISKLFTDIGIMQRVERGEIDLDAPITNYLPEFQPENPFETPITLRQLMSHRSGLVREPPVGNYFDATGTSLAETVASLNPTRIVYAPQSQTKYSNAGIATVGYVLEHLSGEPFAEYLKHAVLDPMGLEDSAFAPNPEIDRRLAHALMWSYDGRTFPAPAFELGMSPAGSMYSTVLDMARFMGVMFNDGMGLEGPVIQPETLAAMFEPQFSTDEEPSNYGIGFRIGELEGHTTYGHGGAIYGFATALRFIPDQQLGVVVAASMDVVNSVTNRITDLALEMMLAQRGGRPLPTPSVSTSIDPEFVEANAGRYVLGDYAIDLIERNGELQGLGRTSSSRIRQRDGQLLIEGRLRNGPSISFPAEGILRIEGIDFTRVEDSIPPPPPAHFKGLMGEYGWDHSVLFIYEKEGHLHALIEWTEIDLLEQISEDVYAFPETSMYHGEQLIFRRGEDGRALDVTVASIVFPRREIQGETAATFAIEPVRPVDELRAEALAAQPPTETGDFLETDLVEVTDLEPGVKLDMRYASTNNFMQTTFYREPLAFMQRPAAEAVARAHRALAEHGYGLLIHDAYRPWYVTKMFWDATPEESKLFVADPSQGSRHNRGCAVDITLYDLETGEPIKMTGLYDEFSERSYPDYMGGTSRQRWHRELLRDAMEAEGFRVYEYEWWHFDFEGWERYRIGNQVFEDINSRHNQPAS
jgi:CubicO group peptidase (beta-lactamase class C family)/D-alanyl-D-alanine dipeptidase